MKCKSCKSAKENCCCHCGKFLKDSEKEYGTNPYDAEIEFDYTEHLICDICHEEACMEV